MTTWQAAVELPEGDGPVFLRLARALMEDIRRGRFRPGQRLPGSRPLSQQLGVNRNTVLAALAELEAQGWIHTEPARGTFVSESLPEVKPARLPRSSPRRRVMPAAGFDLPPAPLLSALSPPYPYAAGQAQATGGRAQAARGVLAMSSGMPDPRLFPVELLARAWRRVVRRSGREVLTYGDSTGHPALRAALAEMLSSLRGLSAGPEHVLVTRGSQMALDVCARGLLSPGDVVAVEALGYRPAWDALRLAGASLVAVPVDEQGIDVGALEALCRRRPVRAVYVTPHHQYPTTVTLSPGRRLSLLDLARRHRFAVLEDDYDHEFHYEGRPVLPLASADDAGHVVYLGTLSKVLAPGLRLGFVIAPRAVVERLSGLRATMDRQGDLAMEAAVADFIEEGELQRHVRKMRGVYRERRDVLVKALRERLGEVVDVDVPRGGISVWARARAGVDVDAWAGACAERGVLVAPGCRYAFDGKSVGALRLAFAPLTPAELLRGVERMAEARAASVKG